MESADVCSIIGYEVVKKMGNEEFGRRLAELRAKKDVSARDMSLSIGQSPGYINNVENGHNYPSMTVFFYICEYLDVTPAEFFDIESSHPSMLNAIIKDMKRLNDKQLDTISTLVKDLIKR